MSKKNDFEKIRNVKEKMRSNASTLDYSRINITLPKEVLTLLDKEYSDTPRSRIIAQLILDNLEKRSKEQFLKDEAKKLADRKDYYSSILESIDPPVYE